MSDGGVAAISFGRRVFETRRRLGLSQKALADAVGVDRTHISKIESGAIGLPQRDLRLRIAAELGVSEADLFDPSTAKESVTSGTIPATLPPSLRTSFLLVGELSPQRQRQLAQYIDDLVALDNLERSKNEEG